MPWLRNFANKLADLGQVKVSSNPYDQTQILWLKLKNLQLRLTFIQYSCYREIYFLSRQVAAVRLNLYNNMTTNVVILYLLEPQITHRRSSGNNKLQYMKDTKLYSLSSLTIIGLPQHCTWSNWTERNKRPSRTFFPDQQILPKSKTKVSHCFSRDKSNFNPDSFNLELDNAFDSYFSNLPSLSDSNFNGIPYFKIFQHSCRNKLKSMLH